MIPGCWNFICALVICALQVVQKGIGYSPEEVTAALSSSDTSTVRDMKDIMKQFQIFLVNFEVKTSRVWS